MDMYQERKLDVIFGGGKSENTQFSSHQIVEEKDEVFNALSDMTKSIQEIQLPNTINTVHEPDSSVDRFKDHVITDNTNKNEGNE